MKRAVASVVSGLALAALAASCAGAPTAAPRAPQGATDAGVARATASADAAAEAAATDPVPTLDALAAGAARTAPGMRELLRRELDAPAEATRLELLIAPSDTCLRVRVVSASAVHASMEGSAGNALAETPSATDVSLAERGPVCVRKGERVTLVLAPREPAHVRLVAWASP